MPTSRVCNVLETLFVKYNVRVICGIQFEEQDEYVVDNALRAAAYYSEMDTASGNWLCCRQEGADYILSIARDVHRSLANFRTHVTTERSLANALNEEIRSVRKELFTGTKLTRRSQATGNVVKCWGIVLNANHAIADGRVMVCFAKKFLDALHVQGRNVPQRELKIPSKICLDFGTVVSELVQTRGEIRRLPLFNGYSDLKALRIQDIASIEPREGDDVERMSSPRDPHLNIPIEVIRNAKQAAATYHSKQSDAPTAIKPSLTGLLMACLGRALARKYFMRLQQAQGSAGAVLETSKSLCGISFSVLVDIRPYLPDADTAYNQAFSTVHVGCVYKYEDCENDEPGACTRTVLKMAEHATREIRSRIENGEVLLNAKKLAECSAGENQYSTVELSNLGIFECGTEKCSVLMGQRFDGYKGVSILMYSQPKNGGLTLSASCGDGIDTAIIRDVLRECAEFLR